MKRTMKILTAALMTSSFAAAPALAGSVGADAGANLGASSGSSAAVISGSAGASAGTGIDADSGNAKLGVNTTLDTNSRADADIRESDVLSAISANGKVASDVSTMSEAKDVTVIELGSADVSADVSADKIDQAVSQNESAVSDLRTSLQANAGVYKKLEAKGVKLSSVIAAKTDANGSLTVYVR